MIRSTSRTTLALTLAALLLTLAPAAADAGGARRAPAGATPVAYLGGAYGTFARVGATVLLGKSAPVGLGACTSKIGVHRTNTVASVNKPPIVTTGVINTTADTLAITGGSEATTSADVHDASVLDGLITATELKSVSTTSVDATGFHTSAAGTVAVGLVVANVPISGTPAPNTVIALPGLGSVTLNEQISKIGQNKASLIVNMLHVNVTMQNPLVPVGTQIIVAHASSGLNSLSARRSLDGFAFGSFARVGSTILAGKSAVVHLPCQGTNGKTKTKTVAGVNVPPLVTSGTVTDTAEGTVTKSLASGETTSTVQTVSVAGDAVTADLVVADTHASSDGTTVTLSDSGSTIVNLMILGQPFGGDPAPNTKVHLAGFGTLWLHRVIQTSNSIEVRMIELIVTEQNPLGIPVGTDIRVADSRASAH